MGRFVLASIAFLYALCGGSAVAQECSHVRGNPWVDEFGFTWYINETGNGWVDTNCGRWSAYGWAVSNGDLSEYAVNDLGGNPECNYWFHYSGHLTTGGCNVADGQWDNDYYYTGNWWWQKTCEVPTGEATHYSQHYWSDASNNNDPNGPYYLFRADIFNSGPNLSGRDVRETDFATAVDNCYFPGSSVPQWTAVTAPPRRD